MKSRLYPNIKHLTTMFCVGILVVTISVTTLRLTLLSDMASASSSRDNFVEVTLGMREDGVPIYGRINPVATFKKANGRGSLYIENPKENECYLLAQITTDETNALVYDSGRIVAGHSIYNPKLQPDAWDLEDGVYACTVAVEARDTEDNRLLGKDTVTMTLYIGEEPGDMPA